MPSTPGRCDRGEPVGWVCWRAGERDGQPVRSEVGGAELGQEIGWSWPLTGVFGKAALDYGPDLGRDLFQAWRTVHDAVD